MTSIIDQIIATTRDYLHKKRVKRVIDKLVKYCADKLRKQKYCVWKRCPQCRGKPIREHSRKRFTWRCNLCDGVGMLKYSVNSLDYPGAKVDYETDKREVEDK